MKLFSPVPFIFLAAITISSLAFAQAAPAVGPVEECSTLYYEQVPTAFARMMKRDGKWFGLAEIQSNKEKDNWNRPCAIKIILSTDKGVELENIAANCNGSKGEEFCRIATQSGTTTLAPGKYKMALQSPSNKLLLEQPFEVIPWDKGYLAVRGDWDQLAALIEKEDGTIGLRLYLTNPTKVDGEKLEEPLKKVDWTLQIALKQKGKQFASGTLRENFRFQGTQAKDVALSFEPAPGILKPLKADGFKDKDGDVEVTVSLGKTELKRYKFKVNAGAIVPHARQDAGYEKKAQAIGTLWPKTDTRGKPVDRFYWIEGKK